MLISKINKIIYFKTITFSIFLLIIFNTIFYALCEKNYIKLDLKTAETAVENPKIILEDIIPEQEPVNEVAEVVQEDVLVDENINEEIQFEDIYKWSIEFPKYNILANINQGVEQDVLNEFVGHFEESPFMQGNVCLASHNRGYKASYFGILKDLQIRDLVIYIVNNHKLVYEIESKEVILDTDWTKIENTTDNILTLITCVEDEPDYRRCIRAVRVNEFIN